MEMNSVCSSNLLLLSSYPLPPTCSVANSIYAVRSNLWVGFHRHHIHVWLFVLEAPGAVSPVIFPLGSTTRFAAVLQCLS